jgi:TP901 family phage tail tape measure protein
MAGSRTLRIQYTGDASGVIGALKQIDTAHANVGDKMRLVGQKLSSAGRTLTRSLTLPIVGAGIAAVKMATDYEDAFTKISAVSNASQKDIDKWKESVKELAGATARDPRELANALFFLASAGLKTSQIMPTLEASAKAAAAGLGDTATIAKLTANTLNAYSGTGLKAARVTDTLVAAVREGSAETDQFGSAMGRILPIASKAGVSFDEVAASLAVLSNIGLDVNEGVTAMRGLLSALEAPGTAAAKTMQSIGISATEMRNVISEEGVLGALRLLEERTHGNIDTMRVIVPNIRALTAVFGLTGQEAEKVNEIFDRVKNSTGSLNKAFEETTKGPAFQFQQALTKLKVAGIDLGEKLLPIALKIADTLKNWATAFSNLSPAMQETIIKVGLLVAALGPLLRITGGLLKIGGSLTSVFIRMGGGAATAAAAASTAAPAVAGLSVGLAALGVAAVAAIPAVGMLAAKLAAQAAGTQTTAEKAAELKQELAAGTITTTEYVASMRGVVPPIKAAAEVQHQLFLEQERLNNGFSGLTEAEQEFGNVTKDVSGLTETQRNRLRDVIVETVRYGGKLSDLEQQQIHNLLAVGDFSGALKVATGAMKEARDKADDLSASIKGIPAKKAIDIIADTAQARAAVGAFRGWVNSLGPVSIGVAAKLFNVDRGVVAQHGFHGVVTQPTVFLAGEAGRERVDITPRGGGGGGGGNIYATITVSGASDPEAVGRKVYEYILKLQRRNGTSGIV